MSLSFRVDNVGHDYTTPHAVLSAVVVVAVVVVVVVVVAVVDVVVVSLLSTSPVKPALSNPFANRHM